MTSMPNPMMLKKLLPYVLSAFVALAVAFFFYFKPTSETPPSGTGSSPSAQVETQPLSKHKLAIRLAGFGVVSTASGEVQTLGAPSASQVERLWVGMGQTVRKHALLAELRLDPAALAATQQARAAVAFNRGEVKRVESLLADKLATQSQLASARKALDEAELSLRTQEQLAGTARLRILAPFDGVIVSLNAAPGDRLAANAPVMQIARGTGGRVHLGIEPEDSMQVATGMRVRVSSVFGSAPPVEANVNQVLGMINPQTQLVDVVVDLPAVSATRLLQGMRVRGDIVVQEIDAYAVPRQAVLRDDQGWHIYQIDKGVAHRVVVRPGLEMDGLVAIDGALRPDWKVVTKGNYELQDGMQVREAAR